MIKISTDLFRHLKSWYARAATQYLHIPQPHTAISHAYRQYPPCSHPTLDEKRKPSRTQLEEHSTEILRPNDFTRNSLQFSMAFGHRQICHLQSPSCQPHMISARDASDHIEDAIGLESLCNSILPCHWVYRAIASLTWTYRGPQTVALLGPSLFALQGFLSPTSV